jgi:hypothetical protein
MLIVFMMSINMLSVIVMNIVLQSAIVMNIVLLTVTVMSIVMLTVTVMSIVMLGVIFCSLKFIKWSKLRKNINRKKLNLKVRFCFRHFRRMFELLTSLSANGQHDAATLSISINCHNAACLVLY